MSQDADARHSPPSTADLIHGARYAADDEDLSGQSMLGENDELRRHRQPLPCRGYGVLLSLTIFAALALWRPWLGVLGLAFVGYLQPHAYAGDFMRELPVYRVLLAATVVGTLFTRDRRLPPRDWRVVVLLAFWVGLLIATRFSAMPFMAWRELVEMSGVLGSTFLILILINTPQKLLWLLVTIALAFGLVSFKGGYWALMHGFADRVYGPPGSQYGDNNHFAVAAVMAIPLLVLWFRVSSSRPLRATLAVAIALSVLAVLSSWSRGGLLATGVTLLLLLPSGRRGVAVMVPVAGALVLALGLLPDQWFDRMTTIATFQTDDSAVARLEVWNRGISFALGRPLLGAGFEGWQFGAPSPSWHSAYIQVMAEQGMINFALWVSLLLGSMVGLTRLGWAFRRRSDRRLVVDLAQALRASLAGYCVGGAFVGIGYWDLPYHLVAAAIILTSLARPFASEPLEAARRSRSD